MGFWSTVGDVAGGVAKHTMAKAEEMNALKQTYANESDSYLARKAKDGNTLEKGTALVALKERGYDTETIKRMID